MSEYIQAVYATLRNIPKKIFERGSNVYNKNYVTDLTVRKAKKTKVTASVYSEFNNSILYKVTLELDENRGVFLSKCTCPYGSFCKHGVATMLELIKKLKSEAVSFSKNQKDVTVKLHYLDEAELKKHISNKDFEKVEKLIKKDQIKLTKGNAGFFKFEVDSQQPTFSNTKGSNDILTNCTCDDITNTLCVHKVASLLYLKKNYGEDAILLSHDYSSTVENILLQAGLPKDANRSKILRFELVDGKFTGIVKKSNFIGSPNNLSINSHLEISPNHFVNENQKDKYINAYLFSFCLDWYNSYSRSIRAICGKKSKRNDDMVGQAEVISSFDSNYYWRQSADNDDYTIIRLITELDDIQISESFASQIKAFLIVNPLMDLLSNKRVYFTKEFNYGQVVANTLIPIIVSKAKLRAKISCFRKGIFIHLKLSVCLNDDEINIPKQADEENLFIHYNNHLYTWNSPYDYKVAMIFDDTNELILGEMNWNDTWDKWLGKVAEHIEIEIDETIMKQKVITPNKIEKKIFLTETGNFLLIYPTVFYDSHQVNANEGGFQIITKAGETIKRETEEEQKFKELIASTHPNFNPATFQPFFHIQADKVLDKFWFIEFYELCKSENIEVQGIENLKKIKYYPARPNINYSFKSNTNWFDLNVSLKYDQFEVTLNDIKKALLKKQDFVKLGNDKLAMLPQEWLKKFSSAIRFGKIEKEGLRLQKSQFALLDELYADINILDLQKELIEKKALLNGYDKLAKVKQPKSVVANLRHYQEEGLNWLATLYKTGLGGCLADDMGLGKTLQMLSLMAHIQEKEKKKNPVNLVVCPTTLLYNWRNEIEKFIPSFKCKVHWGGERDKDTKSWNDYDVIISSYGTLTNDIEWIRKFKFCVAVLDESQAIKNPASLRFKAVGLLTAKQRYVMTGTPIENSTVELFAQMHFINPGLLGSLNAFREDYGSNIDNKHDEYKIEQLRKLIKPFIIRRTKEEVAPELPEKTEQIMYCEMENEQRKVYEAFKNDIRNKIMNSLEIDGLKKSQFTVLEGLTKLRQICDSPALLKNKEDYGTESIKADELIRVITSKVRNHKCLVFSQFLGMLSLIEKKLEKEGINYIKLTGQTKNRQELVDKFESDDACRVFLISLKAGGSGLNLVSADYVFLVDPWWNPAVERQAIDRTHRIGQTKKVFAYRMICKDTIEEKIIELQKQKETLANDIISSEQSFVSKLSTEDIDELLS